MANESKQPLGRLEPAELREYWQDEALHFTPWLAEEENLQLLADTIGIPLELVAQEKEVGPFYADILCRNTQTGEWVVIENQLEPTDHSHLGQTVTYAAGLEATTVVWIARAFREEHRAALDWLNMHTVEGIRFFGITVELWRIGSSAAAPRFTLVSRPNDWQKSVAAPSNLTPRQQLYLRYFGQFRQVVEESPGPLRPPSPSKDYWVGFAVGRSGIAVNAVANARDRWTRVELYLTGSGAKARYDQLVPHRDAVEEITGPLDWQGLRGSSDCRIALTKPDTDPADECDWSAQHLWLRENAKRFHAAFAPLVRALQDEPKSAGPDEAPGEEG